MTTYSPDTLEKMLDGRLPFPAVHAIMSAFKDPDRFDKMLAIHQSRVPWDERILLPYGESLFIVETDAGARTVRCACGHDFGSYRENWKLSALIFVRSTRELMEEIYPSMMGSNPDWMELREFYCPACQRQLEVEAVPPGYPITLDFEPDIDALYEDWLGMPPRAER